MTRGEIWLAEGGRKSRPVVVRTRAEVIDVRQLVTVAEISTSIRGLAAEDECDHESVGLDRRSVANRDGIQRSSVVTVSAGRCATRRRDGPGVLGRWLRDRMVAIAPWT